MTKILKIKHSEKEIYIKIEGIEKKTFIIKLDEIKTKEDFIDKIKEKVADHHNEIAKKQAIDDTFNNLDLLNFVGEDILTL